jgi:hypothetical protein
MLRSALLSALALLVVPTAAQAADLCVAPAGSCPAPQTFATLQPALDAAAAAPGADRVLLGAATYTAPSTAGFTLDQDDPVELVGAGRDQTVVTGPDGTNRVVFLSTANGAAAVRDLTVRIPPSSTASAIGLDVTGDASRIRVDRQTPQSFGAEGVIVRGGGTVTSATVVLPFLGAGAVTGMIGRGGAVTVRDSDVQASAAVTFREQATGLVERTMLRPGTNGGAVWSYASDVVVRDSVIRGQVSSSAFGAVSQGDADGRLRADHVTALGGGGANGGAAWASNDLAPTHDATVEITSSILRGWADNLMGKQSGAGVVTVSTDRSDYDASADKIATTGAVTIAQTAQTFVADPGFVSNDDPHLTAGSPLVDAGGPAAGAADYDGAARVIDGDGDCTAQADVGAFELQAAANPACAAGPDPGPGTSTDTATPTPTAAPAPATAPPAPLPLPRAVARDTTAPRIAQLSVARRKGGRARVRFTLSEAATVTVRAAGKTKRIRVGKRGAVSAVVRLRRGRVTVTAVDAAGNRSSRKGMLR